MKSIKEHEDCPPSIHVDCEYCLLHSFLMFPHQFTLHGTRSQVRLQFCVEAIGSTEGKDCCHLAIALVLFPCEKDKSAFC
jgi:hypothetical protein